MALPTTAGKPAAALPPATLAYFEPISKALPSCLTRSSRLAGDVWFFYWVDAQKCNELAEVIEEPDKKAHEPVLPQH